MPDALPYGRLPAHLSLIPVSSSRGVMKPYAGQFAGRQLLPDDAQGNAVVTFDGVQAGSEIRVFDIDGIEVTGVESCDADHVLTMPAFAPGSNYNDVMVRIISLTYVILEFPLTISVGAFAVPVQQRLDRVYSNP